MFKEEKYLLDFTAFFPKGKRKALNQYKAKEK